MIVPIAALAIVLLFLSRKTLRTHLFPTIAAGTIEKIAAVAAVSMALAVLLRGNVWAALCLFGIGLWLLGRSTHKAPTHSRTRVSRLRSAMIEMDYDQASGILYGRIIAGPNEGIALERLDATQCDDLYGVCRRDDPEGARLLEPYLDRRFAGWRQARHGDADPGETRARHSSRMSEDEAYEVLGLHRGTTRDGIVRAHRLVMKKWHPDQGGTAELAARANEAKEVLLRRHM